jgi:hypothetical protein
VLRLFARFAEVYGSQKTAAMWGDVGVDSLVPVWAEALGRFDAATLGAAVRAMPERDSAWPPTLPEFLALCRAQKVRPEHVQALPLPQRTAEEVAAGAERLAAAKSAAGVSTRRAGDKAWAMRVIERAAAGDKALAPITVQIAREALGAGA